MVQKVDGRKGTAVRKGLKSLVKSRTELKRAVGLEEKCQNCRDE